MRAPWLVFMCLCLRRCVAAPPAKPPAKPRAVLFDFDGSLAQSENAHRKRFAAATGVDVSEARWFAECVGHDSAWIVAHLLGREDAPAEVLRDLAARAASPAFLDDVVLTKGARELLAALEGTPCAIVSSGLRSYIEGCLARWGLSDAFACLVAGDDDEPGEHKPSPAPYLHAAKRLGVAPEDCYAVEDSPSGIQSALAAGVAVVAVLNPANEGLDVLARCAAVVDDLSDTSLFV
mmetsp:Transcript_20414/g.60864  ORF Transcript_20414/g.60864 Transcript_20414/m.60864 type:complete len:235 (+) Transcript_20414:171-875(+)